MKCDDIMDDSTDLLRISEAAACLGVSSKTLRKWVRAGLIPAHQHPKHGYRVLIWDDLSRFRHRLKSPGSESKPS